jgi:predicted HD phosphohydrolase
MTDEAGEARPRILSLDDVRFAGPEAEAEYRAGAREIEARHARQTVAAVEELRRRYEAPVFGDVRVWDLIEMLASCIDASDQRLFGVSQQVHVLQVLEGMERDGLDDPDLVLAALVHDLGKVLLLTDEDQANVVGFNQPIGAYEPGVGLEHCVLQWNHDEFAYSRLREHVPEHVAWLVRYHSIDPVSCEPLMDDGDRERARRYLRVFMQYDHGTKSPYHLPARRIDDYREIVEDAFPKPIRF